jgi:Uma2 family endonuclease
MGMPAAVRHRWTAAEVRHLQDESHAWPRYELIDGELYVTSSPSVWHQKAVMELVRRLLNYLEPNQFADVLTSPADIELEEESILQPDVFVIPRISPEIDKPSWKDVRSLFLAVEVISPSSVHTDRVVKRDQYLRMAVQEYWVIDLDARQVERWFRGRPNVQVERGVMTWQLRGAGHPLTIDLPAFFTDIGLARRL